MPSQNAKAIVQSPIERKRAATAAASAIAAMLCFQTGLALSVPLIDALGPITVTWLRFTGATIVLWLVARPQPGSFSARNLRAAGLLGLATFGMAAFFSEAISRIPLGIATAIEFVGPLTLAVVTNRNPRHIKWAVLAGIGILLLTLQDSGGAVALSGLLFAALAAACWALYIGWTKRIGGMLNGLQGLTLSTTTAALIAIPFGLPQIHTTTPAPFVMATILLGILSPALPYALEMSALRAMSARSFGILTSLNPAIACLIGFGVFQQSIGLHQSIGIACVVAASIGITLWR